jgi:hypothetical protein
MGLVRQRTKRPNGRRCKPLLKGFAFISVGSPLVLVIKR